MQEGAEFYKDKFWYRPIVVNEKTCVDKKRIIVLCFGPVTASYMSFTEYFGDDFIFCFVPYGHINMSTLFFADAVIQVRSMPSNNWVAECCKRVQIPIYYYVDDNFREIFKNSKGTEEYINTNARYLAYYQGVIMSSEKLIGYFMSNRLHDNLLYLPPVITKKIEECNVKKDSVNICFMGGKFREDAFLSYVIPAIIKIADFQKIKLVLPDDEKLRKKLSEITSIDIKWYKRRLNYIRTLTQLNSIGIDILVHPGEIDDNCIYKTKNALLNASLLGANLIASNVPPFNIEDELSQSYVLVNNNVNDWIKVIEGVIKDEDSSRRMVKKSKELCDKYFDSKVGWEKLTKELFDASRNDDLYDKAEGLLESQPICINNTVFEEKIRDIDPNTIVYQPIRGTYYYRFTPRKMNFKEVALAFARDYECEGDISISICNLKKEDLANCKMLISDTIRDGITFCNLDREVQTKGEDMLIAISVKCEGAGTCGVFELDKQRSVGYKIMKKVGMHNYGRNTIWIDER